MNAAVIQPGFQSELPEPGSKPAAVLAFLVHAAFLAVLVFGLRWTSKAPDAVMVELWNQLPVTEPAPQVEPPPPPPPAPEPEPKPVPKVEPKPVPKVAPKLPEPKAPVAARKPDIAIEKQKKPEKPVPREEPKLNLDRSSAIKEQLQRELEQVQRDRQQTVAKASAPPPPAVAPVIDPGYANRIRSKIRGNIVVPSDMIGNPEAIFDVLQIPGGEVIEVRLRKSSGNKGYDDAVERAIRKSSPLPLPARQEQFQRQLELKFRPQD